MFSCLPCRVGCLIHLAKRRFLNGSPRSFSVNSQDGEPSNNSSAEKSLRFLGSAGNSSLVIADYAIRLRQFGIEGKLHHGKNLHQSILKHGFEQNPYLGNLLVQMYARCTDLECAQACFDRMLYRNVFAYNFLLGAYEGMECTDMVLLLFQQMLVENVNPDKVTFVHVLSAYANSSGRALVQGKYLHVCILSVGLDSNFFVATALVNMYGKYSKLSLAESTFQSVDERDLALWNALIAAYAHQGKADGAFGTFERLHQEGLLPDKVTFVNVLSAFNRPDALVYGKLVHASLHEELEGNVVVATALANMYGKCSSLDLCQQIFCCMHTRNVVTWNAMIAVYAQHELGKEALELYYQMKQGGVAGNKVTFVSVLDACAIEAFLDEGQVVHSLMSKYAYDRDVIVGTAVVNMYMNCSRLEDGKRVFDLLQERNIISWNVMMTGFVHHGYGREAIQLFDRMQNERVMPDELTMLAVLCACSLELCLARGESLHNHVLQNGFESDVIVGNALLNMYGKCGCLDGAQTVFDKMPEKSLVTWNSMVAIHSQHGNGMDVLELVVEMQSQGMAPNSTTLSNILSICSHVGLVNECIGFWTSVIQFCQLPPVLDHFDTVVDMLGRAGQLEEADSLLNGMPIQPSALSWTTLLSACKNCADVVRGRSAAKSSVELDTTDEVTYITLSNMYAACGVKDDTLMFMNSVNSVTHEFIKIDGMYYN